MHVFTPKIRWLKKYCFPIFVPQDRYLFLSRIYHIFAGFVVEKILSWENCFLVLKILILLTHTPNFSICVFKFLRYDLRNLIFAFFNSGFASNLIRFTVAYWESAATVSGEARVFFICNWLLPSLPISTKILLFHK